MSDIYDRIAIYCEENQLFTYGDGVVAGLSGGADSVFLLYALSRLRQRWGLKLCAVHVNHGIRGEEAIKDQEYSVSFARSLGISCKIYQGNVPVLAGEWHMTEEEAGRTYRYQCFKECQKKLGFQKIAVAHHQDDQAETVLFQLLRGSSLRGLGGMRPKREQIIRPLLGISRKEIEKALAEEQIAYCQDATNEQDIYARNLLRNHVIPYLQREIQPAAVSHIARTGRHLQEVMEYIDAQRDEVYERIVCIENGKRSMQYSDYVSIPRVLQREVILRMIQELAGQKKDITSGHVQMVCSLFEGETGKKIMLPYGIQAKKSYNILCLVLDTPIKEPQEEPSYLGKEIECQKEYEIMLAGGRRFRVIFEKKSGENFSESNLKKHCTKCFDYDRMDTMPMFRYPEEGDYLWLDQTGKTKKINRMFIDEKVPCDQRRNILVLAQDHHVLWIPALNRCSAYYYVSGETNNVIFAHLQEI